MILLSLFYDDQFSAKKGAAAKGHKLAEKFPEGLTLTDFMKKKWCLGKPIGSGGFGLIYLASMGETKSANPSHVIKVCGRVCYGLLG